jgi:hypothetical protein
MSFNTLWNLFTYICRIFKKGRRPEYTKIDDDDIESEYGELTYDF